MLSITSGVMFARGGRLTRITTAGYGVMSALVGVPLLVGAAEAAFGFVLERAVLWIGFGSVISASVLVPSGTQWFSRPRG
ncbi:hypothetical protein ABT278_38560 [Streptomyces sp. NPDC001228]|uniref:hypothetical protein n=1 Tax=Streptomyces sp. NPDC001228 TaxID=3154381 RepID=UPI0033210A59